MKSGFQNLLFFRQDKRRRKKASDIPSWVVHEGYSPLPGESGKEFAKRVLDDRYGAGNYPTGPGSEYNKLKKHIDRDKSIKRTGEKDE